MDLVAILRVSTEEQAGEDRAGLDRQRASVSRRALLLGATVVKWIIVTDVSRTQFIATPEWREIRELIQGPNVHIICDQPDRFLAGLEAAEILLACRTSGTRIYSADGSLDLDQSSGRLVAVVKAMAAADELESIRERVRGAKEEKRKDAQCPRSEVAMPTGIGYDRARRRWLLTPAIDSVQTAFRMYAVDGVHSFAAIGRALEPPASGPTVMNWFCNRLMVGEVVYDERRASGPAPVGPDGRRKDRKKVKRAPEEVIRVWVFRRRGEPAEPGDDREEAAVTEALFDSVQETIRERRKARQMARGPVGTKFYYTSFLWCLACGEPAWGRSRRGASSSAARRDYYACRRKERGPGERCPMGYLPRAKVHACLDMMFSKMLSKPRLVESLLQSALEGGREDQTDNIAKATRRLDRLAKQRGKLLDLYLAEEWSRAELDLKRLRLDEERQHVERELRAFRTLQEAVASDAALDGLREVLVTLREFEFWAPEQKRKVVGKFFPRIGLSRQGVEIVRVKLPVVTTVGGREVAVSGNELPLDLRVGLTWEQLMTPKPEPRLTEYGLPVKDHYPRRDVRRMLNITEHQLRAGMLNGTIPEPELRVHTRRAWSAIEMQALHDQFASREQPYRWGLPKKVVYQSGDVISILKITFERLRYLLEIGALPDCVERTAGGQRRWTEAELERIIAAFLPPTTQGERNEEVHTT